MIKYLEWDSNFFNKKIGRFDINSASKHEWPSDNELCKFDLIYIFSTEILNLKLQPIDVKVTYKKLVSNRQALENVKIFDQNIHSYTQLLELVYLSGHDSRFLRDQFFGEENYKRLYKKWIDNSIQSNDSTVLVSVGGNKILGFVTMEEREQGNSIGLIAVGNKSQGKGIGNKLVRSVESLSIPNTELTVCTQATNTGACRFYENLDFKVGNKEYIYHYAVSTL